MAVEALAQVAQRVAPVALARDQTLPVLAALESLLTEGGLRRGSTVAVGGGPGATSLALALGAAATAAGSWAGVVGMPSLGLAAACELGVDLGRVVVVDPPREQWSVVVAALLDAVDLVYAAPPASVSLGDARRLVARGRERGSVLVLCRGASDPAVQAQPWPVPADVRLTVAEGHWRGPAEGGAGRLEARRVVVVAGGRGAAARERLVPLWLPGPDGAVSPAADAVLVTDVVAGATRSMSRTSSAGGRAPVTGAAS